MRKRAVGAQYAETATDIEMVSFVCADYGVEEPIAYETMEEILPSLEIIIDSGDGSVQKILPLDSFSTFNISGSGSATNVEGEN